MSIGLKIGVFGFGCVGQGLYDVFKNSKNFQAEILKIVVKHPNKKRSLPADYFSYDERDILENPQINLVVELIDDANAAYRIVTAALRAGKNVVSANKKMIAEHFEELVLLQEETGASLLYEGSACGSIPIIRTLEEYYDNELLYSVSGIFNGSTNYILTKMGDENMDYETALRGAQDLGFAESDPTLDVGGYDAKYKLIIIAAHSYGVFVRPDQIFNYGIQSLSGYDIQYAREKSLKIKQIAKVMKIGDSHIALYVMPQFVTSDNYLYNVSNEYNGVIVEAAFSDQQFFRGKGAGGHPTGSAVLSDISANRFGYKYEYRKNQGSSGNVAFTNDIELTVYFRYMHPRQLNEEYFVQISERYESRLFNYVIARVELENLINNAYFRQEGVFVVEMPR